MTTDRATLAQLLTDALLWIAGDSAAIEITHHGETLPVHCARCDEKSKHAQDALEAAVALEADGLRGPPGEGAAGEDRAPDVLAKVRRYVAAGITYDERPDNQGPLVREMWELLRAVTGTGSPAERPAMGALEAALRGLACRCHGDTEGHEVTEHLTPGEREVFEQVTLANERPTKKCSCCGQAFYPSSDIIACCGCCVGKPTGRVAADGKGDRA